MRASGGRRVLYRYLRLQLPGCLVVAALAFGAVQWWGLSPWLAAAGLALWIAKEFALYPVLRVAYEPDEDAGRDALLGARAVVSEALSPSGWVRVGPERWRAELAPGTAPRELARGETVQVVEVRGLTLLVVPLPGGAGERLPAGGDGPRGS